MALTSEDLEQLVPPSRASDLGVPMGLVEDYFMRQLLTFRSATIAEIADAVAVAHSIGDEIAQQLRGKKLLEYQGAEGRDYRVALTELGYNMTAERMKDSKHVGQIPIPISQYQTLVELQRSDFQINRQIVRNAFSDLVLEDTIIDDLGPAIAADGAIFLYGPPGTGKTSIAERMDKIYDDYVAIPRYVEVERQVISVYDPSVHHPIDVQPENLDKRFILCNRPLLMVGGELDLSSLDLQHDLISGISMAPLQMLANNGILVIDDFGRQTFSPDEILNRWIIPLAQGIDYLRSRSGNKVTIPFELKLILSTNLEPHKLGDDAFLRRMRNKIYIGPCTQRSFDWILTRSAEIEQITLDTNSSTTISKIAYAYLGELRPYIAVDFCQLARTVCDYDHVPRVLDQKTIRRIADLYFIKGTDIPRSGEDPNSAEDFQAQSEYEERRKQLS
jgi:hypothetical protein